MIGDQATQFMRNGGSGEQVAILIRQAEGWSFPILLNSLAHLQNWVEGRVWVGDAMGI